MEHRFRVLLALILLPCLRMIRAAPITVSFDSCIPDVPQCIQWQCCPPSHERPVVDFILDRNSSRPLRIRRALQCLGEDELAVYKEKLEKGYALMRALPPGDPRSFINQHNTHCAYGSGCLDNSGPGLNIHYSWLFHPWHRWFVYFHERILQSLLEDPTFTLHFWNWDNDGIIGPGVSKNACLKAGNRFPDLYADPSSPLFHSNRSWRSLVRSPPIPVDFAVTYKETSNSPQSPDDVVLPRNLQILHDTMVVDSVNTRIFFGREYRAGDPQVTSVYDGIGSLELRLHGSTHRWVGEDMSLTPTAARDPVFYAHHGNIERLWDMWVRLFPEIGNPRDPDFLNTEFLFFDENADLVRVKVRDGLDQRALGYDYEETNTASWNYGVTRSTADDSSTSELLGTLLDSKSQAIRD